MKKTALILMLAAPLLWLGGCSSDKQSEQTKQPDAPSVAAGKTTETVKLTPAEAAKQKLEQAIAAYQDFAKKHRDFLWRDTELHIEKARKALESGDSDIALQEAAVIEKEVGLMQEQVEFAKKNWRKFMVNP